MTCFRLVLLAIIFSLPSLSLFADPFYPIDRSYTWIYQGYLKSNRSNVVDARASIVSIGRIEGQDYYYYSAPSVGMRNFVRTDSAGAYMKLIKYPFPLLSFLTVDVSLIPEIMFMRFPVSEGDAWSQDVRAQANIFGFFKLDKELKFHFEVASREKFLYDGIEYDCYRVHMERDDGEGKIHVEDNWFAETLGYVRGDSQDLYFELKKLEINDATLR
jgi:hypothetical protein